MPRSGPNDKQVAITRGVLAKATRDHGAESPEAAAARRAFNGVKYAQYVERVIAGWPELTGERLDRVAGLLRAGARGGEAPK